MRETYNPAPGHMLWWCSQERLWVCVCGEYLLKALAGAGRGGGREHRENQ